MPFEFTHRHKTQFSPYVNSLPLLVYILVALLRLFPSSVATTSIFSPAVSPTPHLISVSTSSLLPTTTTTTTTKGTFRNSPSTPLTSSSLLLSSTASSLAPPPPPPPIPGVGHSQLRSSSSFSSSTFASIEVSSFDVFFSSSSAVSPASSATTTSYASTLSHTPAVVVSHPTTVPFPSPPPLPSPPSPTVFPSRVLLPTSAPSAASSLSFDVQIESSTVLLSTTTTTSIFSFVPTPTPLPSVIPYEYLVLHLTVSYEQFDRRLFLDEAAVSLAGTQSLIVRDNPYYKNESIVYVNNNPKGTRVLINKFTRMTWREIFKKSSNQVTSPDRPQF